ncbi:glycosyltransferase [Streptomyces sp. 142MFCol3.1]|uniref:glycosyltransferase n=1 Tax=Streptomyces sp. 142MFCol3.1 TaxID=1172179 RepID=UPI001319C97B|nr:glycosyltransferase [Streptomyces sp. 142MFCol3.1]
MSAPVVLHLNNENALTPRSRFTGAFRRLQADGHLHHVPTAPRALLHNGPRAALAALREVVLDARPDVVFVQSPHGFPFTEQDVAQLLRSAGSPTVVYQEGDAWGGNKQLPASSRAWLRAADAVFSVAAGAQLAMLANIAGRPVRYVPHTLPLDCFPEQDCPAPPGEGAVFDVVTIGNSVMRARLLPRLPGARERAQVVRGLGQLDCRLGVFGAGWHGPHARGPLPFERQIAVLRCARMSAGWDHYGRYPGYFSDRLPISGAAGRVHVGQARPGLEWLPGTADGLHLVSAPRDVAQRVRELLATEQAVLDAAGERLRRWVRARLTDLQSLQFMLGEFLALPAPPADPWKQIAAWREGPA